MKNNLLYISSSVSDIFDNATGVNKHYQKGNFLDVDQGVPLVNVTIDGEMPNFKQFGVYEASVDYKLATKDNRNYLQVSGVHDFKLVGEMVVKKISG